MRKLIGIGLALMLAAAPAGADRRPGSDLNLTPQQTAALKGIRTRYEGRRTDLQMRLQARRLELAQLLRQDAPDKASVKSKLNDILDLERDRQQLFVDEIFEAKEHLSAEQWPAFRQRVLRHLLMERRRGRQAPDPDPSN